MKKKIILIFVVLIQQIVIAQAQGLKEKFDRLSESEKGYNELVQVNVSQITLHDFITALGNEHKLNVSVDKELNQKIINNFYNVQVKEVFLFLIQKYDLEAQFLGKILIVSKKDKASKEKKVKELDIKLEKLKNTLTTNLTNDTLYLVARKITNLTGQNIIVNPEIKDKKITGYVLDKSIDVTLNLIAKANNLKVTKNSDNNYYYVDKELKEETLVTSRKQRERAKSNKIDRKNDNLIVKINKDGTIDVIADEVPLIDVIYNVALKAQKNYFLYSKIDGNVKSSFSIRNMSFSKVLEHILTGTKYTFRKESEYFLIGEKNTESLRITELIRLKNRTVENVVSSIPSRITTELEIKEFKELNGLVVTGHNLAILELKKFLTQIDENVPVVQIEVIIFQYEKSHTVQTGLKAGFDSKQQTSSLTNIFPTTDVNLNSNNVNKLINAFNGLGLINLGKVSANFFLSLKALETNNVIKIESTPKVATLSSHEATLKIGETDYYFEQTNRLLTGSVNPNVDVLQSGQWKSTEANLSLKIKPFVSNNENVTLNIVVEKSSFKPKKAENAPPGKTTQQFEAFIRVKNGEMILLGGLDEAEKSNSGTGVPFLSRIPIIKWFFSGREKIKKKKKLHLLIKPTVYY